MCTHTQQYSLTKKKKKDTLEEASNEKRIPLFSFLENILFFFLDIHYMLCIHLPKKETLEEASNEKRMGRRACAAAIAVTISPSLSEMLTTPERETRNENESMRRDIAEQCSR